MSLLQGAMFPIETVEVGAGGQAAMQFNNIPQTYTDLIIYISARSNRAQVVDTIKMTFNNNNTSYSNKGIAGTGSSTFIFNNAGSSSIEDNGALTGDTATASIFGNAEIYIANYTGSSKKAVLTNGITENNAANSYQFITTGLWSNSSAITSITLTPLVGTLFLQHSTATLYGVKNYALTQIDDGAKASGGIVTSDANYWYHTFTSSGTFTPTQNLTADYLVVAGGGGGGDVGGGGGAGGYRTSTGAALTGNTNYTVTIGAGGAGSISRATATNGTNSVFSTITASGGGGGGGINASATASGGSGGGGGGGGLGGGTPASAGTGNAGSYSPAEGYAGGVGGTTTWASGGGGGAGAAGTRPNPIDGSATGGNGGNGLYTAISGGSVTGAGELSGGNYYFAGGGAGAGYGGSTPGTAGLGGGGVAKNANAGTNCTPGTANTGGGGGGAYNSGGAAINPGGSGIVIVRYAK